MEKYNKFLINIVELLEKGLFSSKDLKKELNNALRFKAEEVASKLNLVSREEFEVQKKMVQKLYKDLSNIKEKKSKKYKNKKVKKARRS